MKVLTMRGSSTRGCEGGSGFGCVRGRGESLTGRSGRCHKSEDTKNDKKMFELFSVSEQPIDVHDTAHKASTVQMQAKCIIETQED